MKAVLDHIVLAVRDMDAMLGFYCGVLGLTAERLPEYREGRAPFPVLRLNEDSVIDLLPRVMWDSGEEGEALPGRVPNLNHFCLAVGEPEWRPLLTRLADAGVEIASGPMTLAGARGDAWAVYLTDPDGNKLELRYYD